MNVYDIIRAYELLKAHGFAIHSIGSVLVDNNIVNNDGSFNPLTEGVVRGKEGGQEVENCIRAPGVHDEDVQEAAVMDRNLNEGSCGNTRIIIIGFLLMIERPREETLFHNLRR